MQGTIYALIKAISDSPSYSYVRRVFKIHGGSLSEASPLLSNGFVLSKGEKLVLAELLCRKLSNKDLPLNCELLVEYRFDANAELAEGSIQIRS